MNTTGEAGFEVLRVAEHALLVRFHDTELETAVARAHRLDRYLDSEQGARSGERILGAGNLLLSFSADAGADAAESLDAVARELRHAVARLAAVPGEPTEPAAATGREHRFEVRYGGEDGPDLDAVARQLAMTPERVVELHSGALYKVGFIGFSPGFPYLLGLPDELRLGRRDVPRHRVPAGSVAIAGPFAGIYPSTTPGGWHLVGRTAACLFDPTVSPPAGLAPGDRVRFVARS